MTHEQIFHEANLAEEALAGLAFIHPQALLGCELDPSVFSDPLISKVIDLAKTQSDSQRMVSLAMRMGLEPSRIANLVAKAGSVASVRDYSQDLLRARQAQNLEVLARRVFSEIESNPKVDPSEIVAWIESELVRIRSGKADSPVVEISEVVDEVLSNHEKRLETGATDATPTGFACIDSKTGGMFPGQLWQIAARTYMGKTALALDLAAKMSLRVNVLFVSLEMSRQELVDRLIANSAKIPIDKFAKGDLTRREIEQARRHESKVKAMQIKFTTAYSETVASIRAKIRYMKAQVGCGLVVIDNLQLIKPADHRAPRHERIKQSTIDLKTAARELEVPILILSQLNADAEGNEPNDTHYAGSKETLPDIDVSILMHRESKDHPDVELICTKNRRGGLPFRTKLVFDGRFQSFEEPQTEFGDWQP